VAASGHADGQTAALDLGVEWVAPRVHRAVMPELDRYSTELDLSDHAGLSFWNLDGTIPTAEDISRAEWHPAYLAAMRQMSADAARIDLLATGAQQDVAHIDVSFSEYLRRFDLRDRQRACSLPRASDLQVATHQNIRP
jgi:hypothetical protein